MNRPMDPRANKNLVVRLYKEGFTGDIRGLNRFFAPNFRDHSFFGDLAGLKAAVHSVRQAYPSVTWRVEQCFTEGDRVCVRVAMQIKNALGTALTSHSTSIYRIQNGKITEHWGNSDDLQLD